MASRDRIPSIPEESDIPLGVKIRALRRYRGISLTDLSRRLRYSSSHIASVETGHHNPSARLLDDICSMLWISPTELINASRDKVLNWLTEVPPTATGAFVPPTLEPTNTETLPTRGPQKVTPTAPTQNIMPGKTPTAVGTQKVRLTATRTEAPPSMTATPVPPPPTAIETVPNQWPVLTEILPATAVPPLPPPIVTKTATPIATRTAVPSTDDEVPTNTAPPTEIPGSAPQ